MNNTNNDDELAKVLAELNQTNDYTAKDLESSDDLQKDAGMLSVEPPTSNENNVPEVQMPEMPKVVTEADLPEDDPLPEIPQMQPPAGMPNLEELNKKPEEQNQMKGQSMQDNQMPEMPQMQPPAGMPNLMPEPMHENSVHVPQELDNSHQQHTEGNDPEMNDVKNKALHDLLPLVDKLNVSPEELFNTYLLLLRSTDDKKLLRPTYEAASKISDDAKRAHALLDVVKEVDYLNQHQK